MIYNLYAIRDVRAGTIIGGIHMFPHHAPAVRFFGDIAGDAQTMIARHPKDHDLICLGNFTDRTFTIEPLEQPEVIITGSAWLAAQAPKANDE